MSFNKVILIGRLTHDPTLKQTQNGTKVTSFSIAVNSKRKDNSGLYIADFFTIIAWRHSAEFVVKYFGKGKEILVDGYLQSRNYTDKNGEKHYITEVVAEEVNFVGNKMQSLTPTENDGPYLSPINTVNARAELEHISDDELPF